MDIAKIKNWIESISWYKQGGSAIPFYIAAPCSSMPLTLGYRSTLIYNKGHFNMDYFDKDVQKPIAAKHLKEQIKDLNYISKKYQEWKQESDKVDSFLRKFVRQVPDADDVQLKQLTLETERVLARMWKKAIIIEFFDPWGNVLLDKEISRCNIQLTEEEKAILLSMETKTFLQEEKESRYRLAVLGVQHKDFREELKKHREKFYWIHTNWAHAVEHTEGYFLTELKKDSKGMAKLKKEIGETDAFLKTIKAKKADIIMKNGIPEDLASVFHFFAVLTEWRDIRKKHMALQNIELHKFLQLMCRKNEVSMDIMGNAWPHELTSWVLPRHFIRELEERNTGYAFFFDEKMGIIHKIGKSANGIFDFIEKTIAKKANQLTGTIASRGKVTARVKIIETKADFKKMKKGDIIVASMTRPEYTPILHLASGIITNEGGITCHAAIVARELKIPCIIATQTATHVLKDDDKIELDAEAGTIKKLS